MTNYDLATYPGYPYPQTTPAQVGALAFLHGLNPCPVESAKVLEIGCATGGNLLGLAARFDKSSFVGVDLSSVQIETARKHAEAMSLRNIDFMAQSILDADFHGQKFDYIIAHGLYSWVDKTLQPQILEACASLLEPDGLVFMSYNTLPGWSSTQIIRNMMMYAGQMIENPEERISKAKAYLQFIQGSIPSDQPHYKALVEGEINAVMGKEENFLLHDHMEEHNNPCYFHEFETSVRNAGLAYFHDMDYPDINLSLQDPLVAQKAQAISDRCEKQQYLDFVSNRKFRSSVLTLKDQQFSEEMILERCQNVQFILNCKITGDFQHVDTDAIELIGTKRFNVQGKLQGQIICACLIEMSRALPKRLLRQEIITAVKKRLSMYDEEQIAAEFDKYILAFLNSGILSPTLDHMQLGNLSTTRPKAFDLARYMAKFVDIVPNIHHEVVKLTVLQKILLAHLDGQQEKAALAKIVKKECEEKKISGMDNLERMLDLELDFFRINGLLTG
ncbi:class I SAM-dependent methyltransferase [Terasakiella sp. A23]|uniref:class I SAM-dependent methyltransferase n=1 Tax=Terasakiella sp. FCG-A23 TaxID=3080561 RepID=UPI002954C4C3|nr:class I SAM-dependent methyltransferase [Terasakiella sp. A23]MDV7339808.1 class I SAM-dependent methyltransferase [Terasakiella sp. A23]